MIKSCGELWRRRLLESKNLIKKLGFLPKENAIGIFQKKYQKHDNYAIEVDFNKEVINYGKLITSENKTTQNFSQAENWVVLECVDRLLTKGYKPQNIILEKTWGAGHGSSARLDICVTREDDSEYLLIECKTHGKEFEKAFNRLNKDGGQLFTYFKFSNKPDVIMLYASTLKGQDIIYENHIIKIEEDYRTGDVKDFFDKWNKLTKENGIFEDWVTPYCFESKALVKSQLKPIRQEDSGFIFSRFLEILRHNVVSDKGNAFNKIFTLFLCKVYDETTKGDNEELDFQWFEGVDNDVKFQLRLTDLYKKGMLKFLSREVSDFDEDDFNRRYKNLSDEDKKTLLFEIHKLRLEKNNEFAIKEVYDNQSFKENAKIVKEVVELLQGYRIRYNKRQQYLSDFFELLLTTGLKQEAGQFFTPVPIAQFILKSLPLENIVNEKLNQKDGELLPFMIDYAAGSGHFITEYMHEVQSIINNKKPQTYIDSTAKKIKNWQEDHFDWATTYVYGIEKDYRLVKVGKVGCYLHGDGLANVILSDGLGNFTNTKDYKGKLRKTREDGSKDNQQFDILLSNPPYSVESFKQTTRDYYTEQDFDLYQNLTDNSSEIECLFIERTKQLLRDGGIAGIILPNSILNNSGIYTKAREMILQYFDIIAIAELGSNTFMATNTNTVVLFLKRRNNFDCININKSVEKFFTTLKDITINTIENPVEKYIIYAWEDITFEDYVSLIKNQPNKNIQKHDLYNEYLKKIKSKSEKEFFNTLIEIEKEKFYYFILTYNQKTVLVKTGKKNAEKKFLGYEFSNRRGSEGIHSTQKGKNIDECTSLFDAEIFNNPQKASTYIYQAFNNDFKTPIDEKLAKNVSRVNLVDLLTFDRVEFEKSIFINSKKKIKIESKFKSVSFDSLLDNIIGATTIIQKKETLDEGLYEAISQDEELIKRYTNNPKPITDLPLIVFGDHTCRVKYLDKPFVRYGDGTKLLKIKPNLANTKYVYYLLNSLITPLGYQRHYSILKNIKLPIPPIDIQEKIIVEIAAIEANENELNKKINNLKVDIENITSNLYDKYEMVELKDIAITNPSKAEIKDLNLDTTISFIDMQSVSNDGYIINMQDRKYSEVKKGSYTYFKKNDIIVAKITPCMENGKCALANELKNEIAFGSSEFHVIRASDKVLNKYLFKILNRKIVRQEAEKNMTGASGHRRVPIAFYEKLDIPLPSIKEQQKIVAEIEKLEVQINEAQKIIDNACKLKNEILKKYL